MGSGGRTLLLALRERHVLFNPSHVGFVNQGGLGKLTLALRALALQQVAFASLRAKDFARPGDFEPLGHGLLRLTTCD